MKKKFVTLGIMMALSMTVAAGCGQKAGVETTAQAAAESTAADTTAADAAADTTQADAAGTETTAAAQSDDSYQYVSAGDAVAAAKDKSAHVLDVREWDNYVKGRVADSVWCPIFPLEDDSLADGQYYLYMFNNNYASSSAYTSFDWSLYPGTGDFESGTKSMYYKYLVDESKGTYKLVSSFTLKFTYDADKYAYRVLKYDFKNYWYSQD